MKLLLLAASAGAVFADTFVTDDSVDHIVYNCDKVRQDVEDANDAIGDGVCHPEVNCGPFSYDLGDCWESTDDICQNDDSWYTNGRDNFRCSTKTGGIRFGRAGSNDDTGVAQHDAWSGPCDCYEECKQQSEEEDIELVAFDMYSGKCRCWSGICSWDDALPCRNGGDDYGVGAPNDGGDRTNPDLGNNWRCPAEIYFPFPRKDCDGTDITFHFKNIETYIGDGFCDDGSTLNQQYAQEYTTIDIFNFNCAEYNYDGGDCKLDCHESIYWATNFVNLHAPFEKVDECTHGQPVASTEFTTACDCYSFCADYADDTEQFIFDHDDADMCRCFVGDGTNFGAGEATLATVTDTTFCGLNSDCQIYEPNRERMCPSYGDVDYTLGVYDGGDAYNASDIGETVVSYDSYTSSMCVSSAMCQENSYSHGACFECGRFSTDKDGDSYCGADTSTYASISSADLSSLISDGYLQGDADAVSQSSDNCACLNYCVSSLPQYIFDATGDVTTMEEIYDNLNVIAGISFGYSIRNDECQCHNECPNVMACGTTGGDCNVGAINTVYYSTVADLNILS